MLKILVSLPHVISVKCSFDTVQHNAVSKCTNIKRGLYKDFVIIALL